MSTFTSPTRIIEVTKNLRTLFELNTKPEDNMLIVTDTAMDPSCWQAAASAANELDCQVSIAMMTPRPYVNAEPTAPVAEAMVKSDVVVYITSKPIAHCKAGIEVLKADRMVVFMEEINMEIMSSLGAALTKSEYSKMNEEGQKIREILDKGHRMHIASDFGTDLTVTIGPGRKPWVLAGFRNSFPPGGYACGFPDGLVGVGPEPGTSEGTLVYDTWVHYPPGSLKEPIELTIEKGWIKKIEGGLEARQLKDYIETYGDRNSWMCPSETSLGLNPKLVPTGVGRTDKKLRGAMIIALGKFAPYVESKLHIDGVIRRPTVEIDGRKIVDKGIILV